MEGKGIEERKERERDLYYGASEREGENRIESKVGERGGDGELVQDASAKSE